MPPPAPLWLERERKGGIPVSAVFERKRLIVRVHNELHLVWVLRIDHGVLHHRSVPHNLQASRYSSPVIRAKGTVFTQGPLQQSALYHTVIA